MISPTSDDLVLFGCDHEHEARRLVAAGLLYVTLLFIFKAVTKPNDPRPQTPDQHLAALLSVGA